MLRTMVTVERKDFSISVGTENPDSDTPMLVIQHDGKRNGRWISQTLMFTEEEAEVFMELVEYMLQEP